MFFQMLLVHVSILILNMTKHEGIKIFILFGEGSLFLLTTKPVVCQRMGLVQFNQVRNLLVHTRTGFCTVCPKLNNRWYMYVLYCCFCTVSIQTPAFANEAKYTRLLMVFSMTEETYIIDLMQFRLSRGINWEQSGIYSMRME